MINFGDAASDLPPGIGIIGVAVKTSGCDRTGTECEDSHCVAVECCSLCACCSDVVVSVMIGSKCVEFCTFPG